MTKQKKRVHACIAGGGTGGHVMPALALADALREQWQGAHVSFIGAKRGLEATLLPERGEAALLLDMHAIQGVGMLHRVRVLLWEMPKAVWKIRQQWKCDKPQVLVGVGGYASATGVVAALVSGVPVVLYEQNARLGLVNRTLARFCQKMMLGFSEVAKEIPHVATVYTGNMVRQSIHAVRWQAHTPPCLLVMGGSQGALFLNDLLPQACAVLKSEGFEFQVKHVCGSYQQPRERIVQQYADAGVTAEVMVFCDDMPSFYAQGDLLVARAGAMTLSEVGVVGMPALFVPLPTAADQHQWFNARSLSDQGAALCLQQADGSVEVVVELLRTTLCQPKVLEKMSQMTWQCAKRDAKAAQLAVLAEWMGEEEV